MVINQRGYHRGGSLHNRIGSITETTGLDLRRHSQANGHKTSSKAKHHSSAHEQQYKEVDKAIPKNCRKDKQEYLESICENLESKNDTQRHTHVYKHIRQMKKSFAIRMRTIKDDKGCVLQSDDEIRQRWKTYKEALCAPDPTIQPEPLNLGTDDTPPPELLSQEVRNAIKHMNNNKACGVDDLPIELFKAIEDDEGHLQQFTALCNKIIMYPEWPEDFSTSRYIPIYKKRDSKNALITEQSP